ncbi:MAG: hypothetical protein MUC99_05410, partial [Anaerolineae bacterium]|nr:hypothetical protein [Anaerolineae bacterium]
STGQAKPRSVVNLWTSRLMLYDSLHPRWKAALARRIIAVGMARKAQTETDPALRDAYRTVADLATRRNAP